MACLDINSLLSHIHDLRVVVSQFKDIDLLVINETKLDANIKDGEVHLPGYDVVRKDRESNGRNGGGVCIYVLVFVVISIFSFVLILVRIILNVSLLKSLNPAQSLSSCLPGTDHHNHLLTSFQRFRELLIKLTLKTWSYILWVT